MDEKVNILVVDSKDYFKEAFKMLLKENFKDELGDIFEASDVYEFYKIVEQQSLQLIFIETEFVGNISGLDAVRYVRIKQPQSQIFGLSVFDDNNYVRSFISAGANGYLSKNENLDYRLSLIKASSTAYSKAIFSDLEIAELIGHLFLLVPKKMVTNPFVKQLFSMSDFERRNLLLRFCRQEKLFVIEALQNAMNTPRVDRFYLARNI